MEVLLSYSRHHNVCPQFEMTHQKHLDSLESYHMLLYDCGFLHIRCLRDANELALHRWLYVSIGELPSHGHEISSANLTGQFQICSWCGGGNRSGIVSAQDIGQVRGPDGDGKQSMLLLTINASHNHTAGNTGGGSAHNVMQPYQTVYRWKRTG